MFLAIINDTYADVKAEIASSPTELQLTRYVLKLLEKCGIKLPGLSSKGDGDDGDSKENANIKKIRGALKR